MDLRFHLVKKIGTPSHTRLSFSFPFRRLMLAGLMLAIPMGNQGCGKAATPPLAKVSGVISLDGKPLTAGTVQFIPDKEMGTAGRMAVGTIQSNGHYELTSVKPGDGAQVGHHIVVIQAFETAPPVTETEPPPPRALIPLKYTDPDTSELRAEVKKGTRNEISFDLK
ncbi:MAG TPA: hypothetical protein VNQ76_23140 [Planctomicrobium sp.]|nr:hypothetical protein [Planctomicrobium sp.]